MVLDNGRALQKGDSGSWAVDDEGRWVGSVAAISGGDAYLIPAHVQLGEIRSHFPARVDLPSPLRCYLELASDESLPGDAVKSFAVKALTRDVLIASASEADPTMDRVVLALAMLTARLTRRPDYECEDGLRKVLCGLGTKLALDLAQPDVPPQFKLTPAMLPEARAFQLLKEAYGSITPEDRRGTRAEISRLLFNDQNPANDGNSSNTKPRGASPDDGRVSAMADPHPGPFSEFAKFVAMTREEHIGRDLAGNPKPYIPLSALR